MGVAAHCRDNVDIATYARALVSAIQLLRTTQLACTRMLLADNCQAVFVRTRHQRFREFEAKHDW